MFHKTISRNNEETLFYSASYNISFDGNKITMAEKIFLFLALFVGMAWAQSSLPELPEGVSLPPELQGKVDPKDLEKIQNQSLSEFQEKCEKNGGPDAFAKAQNASQQLGTCVTSLVDPGKLQAEIEEAKPNGNVDEVFKKYCAKKPLFENCIKNFTETSKVCLAEAEQKHLKTVYNVSEQLAEFICFKEGDRIALFIAEGGQECFQDKQEGLIACLNQTADAQPNLSLTKSFDPSSLANFTLSFDEKQCKQLSELQTCVVNVLDGCAKPTSANIVESLFKFIRKATPCKNFADPSATPKTKKFEEKSSASTNFATTATLLMAATTMLLV